MKYVIDLGEDWLHLRCCRCGALGKMYRDIFIGLYGPGKRRHIVCFECEKSYKIKWKVIYEKDEKWEELYKDGRKKEKWLAGRKCYNCGTAGKIERSISGAAKNFICNYCGALDNF